MIEVPIKRGMIAAASRVVLLADARKFAMGGIVRVCGAEELDGIVTDATREEPAMRALERAAGRGRARVKIALLGGAASASRWSTAHCSGGRGARPRRGRPIRPERGEARADRPVLEGLERELGERLHVTATTERDEALEAPTSSSAPSGRVAWKAASSTSASRSTRVWSARRRRARAASASRSGQCP